MRILFYSHTGLVSGAEHVLLNTLKGLDLDAFEPLVLCPAEGELTARVEACSVPVVAVEALDARFTSSPVALLRYLLSFCRVISDFRARVLDAAPDVIHANSVRAGLVAVGATIGLGMPVVWHVHDDLPKHPISSLIRVGAYLSRRSIFLAVSASTARIFSGRLSLGKRMHTLHNGIDLQRFPEKRGVEGAFRNSLGISDRAFLVCAVGMINPRKDLLGLVKAFALVQQRHAETHLAIVGRPIFNRDDLYLEEVRELAKELGLESIVHFTGSQSDVASVLRSSNLLVLNAKVEPFGLVLVEAMASGTAVLATRVGGIPEIVSDNVTGFLVEPGQPEQMAARMVEIISDLERVRRVARMARERACTQFSVERYSAEYNEIVREHFGGAKGFGGASDHAGLKVALFHDNFAQSGGAEGVAESLHRALCAAYPDTHLLSTLTAEARLSSYLRQVPIRTTWMQHLPAKAKLFRGYFLLYPFAVDRVDLRGYDLVVTSCFGYAKGVRRGPDSLHVCYCHTPMRWVWRTEDYLSRERNGGLKKLALALPLRWLKRWELEAASHPDLYVANSSVVADRLFRAFGVHAVVIHPPIATSRFAPLHGEHAEPEDFYLVLARLVPYKRLDLAVEACTRTHRSLIVVGDGPDRRRLESMAGSTVKFLGRAPIESVIDHAQRCRALLFPGEEDFGMTPLEVNAAGRPVVAFRGGGATETIVEGVNGVFFDEPSVESMIAGIERLEAIPWDSAAIQRHAQQFDEAVFAQRMQRFLREALAEKEAQQALKATPVTV